MNHVKSYTEITQDCVYTSYIKFWFLS